MVVVRDVMAGLLEYAGVGKGRHGSGGHWTPVLALAPVERVPTAEQPDGETDVFVTGAEDGRVFFWRVNFE
jgi:hypothetical protein